MGSTVQVVFNIVLGLLTVLASAYAARVAARVRRAEVEAGEKAAAVKAQLETRIQSFSELSSSLAAAREDLAYQKAEAAAARTEKARLEQQTREDLQRVRDEWESRWSRQMDRCRKVTDQATATITRLMGQHTLKDETEAERTLREMHVHIDTDHT